MAWCMARSRLRQFRFAFRARSETNGQGGNEPGSDAFRPKPAGRVYVGLSQNLPLTKQH